MSITIEHDKRKREILERALDVFVEQGYEDTTFQKIAERCGITRTILYLYFKNKREIFSFSIKLFTERLEASIKGIEADPSLTQAAKLNAVISMILGACAANDRMVSVILAYLNHMRTAGGDPDERVRRRTIRLRHHLAGIVIEGQRKGEFEAFSVKAAGDLLYALIEAALFRIAILGRKDVDALAEAAGLVVAGLSRPPATAQAPAGRAAKASAPPKAAGAPKAARGEEPRSAAPRRRPAGAAEAGTAAARQRAAKRSP